MMNFYELTAPDYSSEKEERFRNPVKKVNEVFLPGITCDECGDTWASSERFRVSEENSKKIIDFFHSGKYPNVIPIRDWFCLQSKLAELTGLPERTFFPGMEVSPPFCNIHSDTLEDFIYPFPGYIWVNSKVRRALEEQAVKGIQFIKAHKNPATLQNIDIWEMFVYGKAWTAGVTEENIIVCKKCQRSIFPDKPLEIDTERWDGSDVFTVNSNPNITIISEKVKSVLESREYTNYRLISL